MKPASRKAGLGVQETSKSVLLLIDFINPLEFDGAEKLLRPALAAARTTAALKLRARKARIPVIYVNDNWGRWQSSHECLLRHCHEDAVRGAELANILRPAGEDYFVLKPRHSVFFGTPLSSLLEDMGAQHLVLTGMTTESCVLTAAQDAHMRGFKLSVPKDCVASASAALHRAALLLMRTTLKASVGPAAELAFRV
jgi:nicotinamidase-related amidase